MLADIILSPFKPQAKNVTVEDVASSLYYVHLEIPSAGSQTSLQSRPEESAGSSQPDSLAQSIPRKPLPTSAKPRTPDDRSPGVTQVQLHSTSLPDTQVIDDSIAGSHTGPADSHGPLSGLLSRMPARKPLGIRSTSRISVSDPNKLLPSQPSDHINIGLDSGGADGDFNQFKRTFGPSSYPKYTPKRRASSTGAPLTLTLIRRDPSSGRQWNVARVSSWQSDHSPAEQRRSSLFSSQPQLPASWSSSSPIDIEVENSGYAKFRGMPMRYDAGSGIGSTVSGPAGDASLRRDVGIFWRQAVMMYSKSWTATVKNTIHRIEQAGRSRIEHRRSGSVASIDSVFFDGSAEEAQGLKPRGYAFQSPWGGRCEFRTGNGGRSVQCRHVPHDGEAFIRNPLSSDANSGARPQMAVMSELRFNLPVSELLGDQARREKDQWRGNFSKLLNANPAMDEEHIDADDTISPFEVNVGSERAGGGNRGKRAKLGKLIIYNDGLKMLDLLVAANIGVWWGAWEKMF